MLITLALVTCAFGIILFMKIMNSITFKCFSKNGRQQNSDKLSGFNRDLIDPLVNEKHLSVIKTEMNPCKFIGNIFRRKLKLTLLVITSLTTALIFLLTVSVIRSRMIEYKIEQYQNHFVTKEMNTVAASKKPQMVINEIDSKTSKFTLFLSYDICKLINDQFLEDYILIFISFPITVLIYLWNAYICNKDHEFGCRLGKLRVKRKQRQKNISSTPDGSR